MLRAKLLSAAGKNSTGGGGGSVDPLGDDFVLVVDTTLAFAGKTVRIPLFGPFSVTIDWGDGNITTHNKSSSYEIITHTYASDGEYTVTVSGTINFWYVAGSNDRNEWKECLAIGTLTTNLNYVFINAMNLVSVPEVIPPGATSMTMMLRNTSSLKPSTDLTGWCVTNITSDPTLFADGSTLDPSNYPIWGTCPA